ncbi:MAG: MFS transporter [Acidimicrobiales bacterium]
MNRTFTSLRVRNYRLFASGQLVSLVGTWMQRTGQDWLVLKLSHNSGSAAGITLGLQFLPLLMFAPLGGVLADRLPKRKTLYATQTAMALLATALGLLVVSSAATLYEVYAFAFALGCATAIDNPTRQAFVSELVGHDQIANAVGLNSATFNGARLIGPAVAGVMIDAVGTGWVFLANAISFIAVLTGLALMREEELFPAPRLARAKGQIREGFRYVAKRRELVIAIFLVGIVGMLGLNFPVTLALMDKTVFHRSASAYGILTSVLAVGSLAGALVGARRKRLSTLQLALAAAAFGVAESVASVMPNYETLAVVLVPTGFFALSMSTMANTTVQLAADPGIRGRVMGVYMLVFLGSTPIGAPIIGWASQELGARAGLYIGGLASLAAALVALALIHAREVAPMRVEQTEPDKASVLNVAAVGPTAGDAVLQD